VSAMADRYEPAPSFKQAQVRGVVPHEELASKKAQIWLIQLPSEVDLDGLAGGRLKVTGGARPGGTMTLKTPDGLKLKFLEEAPMLAQTLYTAAPDGSACLTSGAFSLLKSTGYVAL